METGSLVYTPSLGEVAAWRMKQVLVGLPLIIVSILSVYLGLKGALSGDGSGGGAALATVMTVVAGLAIGIFGIRYLLLGLRGNPIRLYELALEADLFGRLEPNPGIAP